MFCAKIGGDCPHLVIPDPNYVFVLMPFKNSETIYAWIKQSVEDLSKKNFICERADRKFAAFDIWCEKICRSILRAKYLIVDASGLNPNVMYELGFAHALARTKNIIISQSDIKALPFDIRGYNVIRYEIGDLPKFGKVLQKALLDLEEESSHKIERPQFPEEMIKDLKKNLREEEIRADKFKSELRDSESQVIMLKKRITEMETIVNNPEKEAHKLLAIKEGEIYRLKKEISLMDKKQKQELKELKERMKEEKNQFHELQEALNKFKQTGNKERLSIRASQTKRDDWKTEMFEKGKELRLMNQPEEAFAIFTELIEREPDYKKAYYQRAFCLRDMEIFEGSLADLNHVINLNPKEIKAYSNRGLVYSRLGNFERSIEDLNKALSLNRNDIPVLLNKTEVLIVSGKPAEAEKTIRENLEKIELIEHQAVAHYLLAIALKLQNKGTKRTDTKLNSLLKSDFTTKWTFAEIEIWLKKASLKKDIKDYIRKKMKMLKKHWVLKAENN